MEEGSCRPALVAAEPSPSKPKEKTTATNALSHLQLWDVDFAGIPDFGFPLDTHGFCKLLTQIQAQNVQAMHSSAWPKEAAFSTARSQQHLA